MMRKLLVCLGMVTLFTTLVHSQEKVPKEVKETFMGQYLNAENVEYKDKLISVVVSFTLQNERMNAYYTRKGQWKFTEKDWTFDQLPENVKDGFQKSKYADWETEETKIIYKAGGVDRYRVKVKKNDLQKKYLFFNKDGRLEEDALAI